MNFLKIMALSIVILGINTLSHTISREPSAYQQFEGSFFNFDDLNNQTSSYSLIMQATKSATIIAATLQNTISQDTTDNSALLTMATALNELSAYIPTLFTYPKISTSNLIAASQALINYISLLNQLAQDPRTQQDTLTMANTALANMVSAFNAIKDLDYSPIMETDTTLQTNFSQVQTMLNIQ